MVLQLGEAVLQEKCLSTALLAPRWVLCVACWTELYNVSSGYWCFLIPLHSAVAVLSVKLEEVVSVCPFKTQPAKSHLLGGNFSGDDFKLLLTCLSCHWGVL